MVSFSMSKSFKNSAKNLNILEAAPDAGTNFSNLKFDLLASKKSDLLWKSFSESFKIPLDTIAGSNKIAFEMPFLKISN